MEDIPWYQDNILHVFIIDYCSTFSIISYIMELH